MIGGFLQADRRIGRETAQFSARPETGLAAAGCCGSLAFVVAVHSFRTGTGSLYRYPSFNGRSALPLGSPSIFFPPCMDPSRDRRSSAQAAQGIGPAAGTGLHLVALTFDATERSHCRKGCQLCRLPNGSRVRHAPLLSQLAATRRLSRASSGRARVQGRLSCWTAIRSPGLLSAARPTSSIASVTPRAADTAGLTPPFAASRSADHRTASRPGGFLLSEDLSPKGRSPRDQAPEGT